jgi:hypothetical protein
LRPNSATSNIVPAIVTHKPAPPPELFPALIRRQGREAPGSESLLKPFPTSRGPASKGLKWIGLTARAGGSICPTVAATPPTLL